MQKIGVNKGSMGKHGAVPQSELNTLQPEHLAIMNVRSPDVMIAALSCMSHQNLCPDPLGLNYSTVLYVAHLLLLTCPVPSPISLLLMYHIYHRKTLQDASCTVHNPNKW